MYDLLDFLIPIRWAHGNFATWLHNLLFTFASKSVTKHKKR
ncbi:hypothetical protein PI172_0301 [Prevotella intermedia]|uniref:Uncharacterized protein n=1 Tax=Prevotella intermedia TaxID=28131 RepID=A0AAD1F6C1_PREIN|nr:hypothetical protein PI172_0301 [Prevotella intermedia]